MDVNTLIARARSGLNKQTVYASPVSPRLWRPIHGLHPGHE